MAVADPPSFSGSSPPARTESVRAAALGQRNFRRRRPALGSSVSCPCGTAVGWSVGWCPWRLMRVVQPVTGPAVPLVRNPVQLPPETSGLAVNDTVFAAPPTLEHEVHEAPLPGLYSRPLLAVVTPQRTPKTGRGERLRPCRWLSVMRMFSVGRRGAAPGVHAPPGLGRATCADMSGGELSGDLARVAPQAAMKQARKNNSGLKAKQKPRPSRRCGGTDVSRGARCREGVCCFPSALCSTKRAPGVGGYPSGRRGRFAVVVT